MADRPRVLSVCSGIGGLDLGIRMAIPSARTILYVEREAFCVEALGAAMEAAVLDEAPVWSDLTTFDGRAWRGAVDLVASGIPCQPYSRAGQRLGNEDGRALWPELVRVVDECGARAVFIENTPDLLAHSEPLWSALVELGFEFAPPWLSTASEYGAIHDRERVFLFAAHPDRARLEEWQGEPGNDGAEREAPERDSSEATNPDGRRLEGEWCGWIFDRERQAFRHNAHGRDLRCRVRGSHWETESPPARLDDGASTRIDWTRALGNGVVPTQAAAALRALIEHHQAAHHDQTNPKELI